MHRLDPITLKGISGEIVPYAVEGIHETTGQPAETINESGNGLSIFLDITKLDGEARRRAEAVLEKALGAVRMKGGQA